MKWQSKKPLILALVLILISAVIGWLVIPAFDMYLLYSPLDSEGLMAKTKILKKEGHAGIPLSEVQSHLV